MNKAIFPSKAQVQALREKYKEGERVELVTIKDLYTSLKVGDRGTVLCVDDAGTVHVKWDCGTTLGIVYGVDFIKKL